jgi:hypothetical protein
LKDAGTNIPVAKENGHLACSMTCHAAAELLADIRGMFAKILNQDV